MFYSRGKPLFSFCCLSLDRDALRPAHSMRLVSLFLMTSLKSLTTQLPMAVAVKGKSGAEEMKMMTRMRVKMSRKLRMARKTMIQALYVCFGVFF